MFNIIESELEINDKILEFYKREFIAQKADNVRIENNKVKFNNIFLKIKNNWNIMVPVDKGIITIKNEIKNEIVIEYLFSVKVILIISVVLGIILILVFKKLQAGLIAFFWLGGMNWLIAIIRHSIMFRNLNNELKDKFFK